MPSREPRFTQPTQKTFKPWTCPKCGRVYNVSSTKTGMYGKDQQEISCACGKTIFSGLTTHNYSATFVKQGDPKDAKTNPSFG